MEFIFDDVTGQFVCSSVSTQPANQPSEKFFYAEETDGEIKTMTMQKKCYKDVDELFGKCFDQISLMQLEHEKENGFYKILKELFEVSKHACLSELENVISSNDQVIQTKVRDTINAHYEYVFEKISANATRYKRKKQLEKNPLFVQPQEKAVGIKWVSNTAPSSDLSDWNKRQTTCQFVSMIKTIQSLFACNQFSEMYFNFNRNKHKCTEGVFVDFCCGSKSKESRIFDDPNTLQLQIAFDEAELCEGLKSKAGVHKVLAIYFQIRNTPPEYRSRQNNVYIVSLCVSPNLKENEKNFNKVCRLFLDELKIMESEGIPVKCADGTIVNLKGALTNILADNLGFNSVFGFIECFSQDYFCRFCNCTKKESEKMTQQRPELMRSVKDYIAIMNRIESGEKFKNYKPTKGIKTSCIFNELNEFHILKNYAVDAMHDVLEGIGAYAVKNLLEWMNDNVISANEVIRMIRDFDYGIMSKQYKPSFFSLNQKNLHQSARQMHSLLINLPFVLLSFQNDIGAHWKPMQSLLGIMQIIFSNKITTNDLVRLGELVTEHLVALQEDFGVKLLPKHHFMLHYIATIEAMGPVLFLMMMRFDAKHKVLTDYARKTNNFVNIAKTLVERHQAVSFQEFGYADKIEKSKKCKSIKNCDNYENFREYLPAYLDNDETKFVSFVTVNGYDYRPNLILIHENELLEINTILSFKDEFYFLCFPCIIKKFNRFCNSVEIEVTSFYKLVAYKELNVKRSFEKIIMNGITHVAAVTLDFPKNEE